MINKILEIIEHSEILTLEIGIKSFGITFS